MKSRRIARHSTLDARRPALINFGVQLSAFSVRRFSPGFTIFELLAVITIIGVVLAVTLGSFTGWGDAHAVRGSADVVEAALNQARDYAITRRVPVSFEYQTAVTNAFKKYAEFQLIRQESADVATNLTLSAADDTAQLLGSAQRLNGNVWLTQKIVNTSDTAGREPYAADRFVFLPNGKVFAAGGANVLFVVSRKLRDDYAPAIIYRIDIDSDNGTATASKCDPNTPSSYSP